MRSVQGTGFIMIGGSLYRFRVSSQPGGGYRWSAWREGEAEPLAVTDSVRSLRQLLELDSLTAASGCLQ